MRRLRAVVLVAALACVVLLAHLLYPKETRWVRSAVDGRQYLIRSNGISGAEAQQNADALAEVNRRVLELVRACAARHPKLVELYSPSRLSEAAVDSRYTSYTLDKRDIHVCLRTRSDAKRLYDVNTLMYVIVHELAHMANWDRTSGQPILGHGSEFRAVFAELLQAAVQLGLYRYEDYAAAPTEYCGIVINSNVLG